jgi:hypothetical protein
MFNLYENNACIPILHTGIDIPRIEKVCFIVIQMNE